MVAESVVLLRVEHFQQCGSRVAAEIGRHLVNFIKQKYRVHYAAGLHAVYNTTRHSADIGAAVSADFRFIVHAAQRHARKLTVDSTGNGLRQRCFADTRRPDEAQNRPFTALGQRAHCKVFQDALLNLFQTVMVFI